MPTPLAPVSIVFPSIGGATTGQTAAVGTPLTCTDGTWAPGVFAPTADRTWRWLRDDNPITGATTANYTVQVADVGTVLTCEATASNTGGSTPAKSGPVAAKAGPSSAGPPINQQSPTVTGTARQGRDLSCSQGSWLRSPTSYAYRWKRDGSAITGATTATYTVQADDVGKAITCSVTATNADGDSQPVDSEPVTPIAAIPAPVNQTVPEISGKPWTGETLTCSNGTWSPEAATYEYAWKRNGGRISDADAVTYVVREQDDGKQIACTVTAVNSGGRVDAVSEPVTGKTVFGGTDLPVNTVKPQISGVSRAGMDLHCAPGTWANGATKYYYGWLRNDVRIKGINESTYKLQIEDAGTDVKCLVVATNEAGQGLAGSVPLRIAELIIGQVDRKAPVIANLKVKKRATGWVFKLHVSENSQLSFLVERRVAGYRKRVGAQCKPVNGALKRKLARRLDKNLTTAERQKQLNTLLRQGRCWVYKKSASLRSAAKLGIVTTPFSRQVGTRVLRPAKYRLSVSAKDAAGNVSITKRASFTIVKSAL